MSLDLEGSVRSQYDLYGRIARSYDNLKKMGSAKITLSIVEARLQSLESNWSKFESQHDKLVTQHWELLANHDYQQQKVFDRTEEAYLTQKALFLDGVKSFKNATSASEASSAPTVADASRPPRSTLPRIQLPHFSGIYEEWPAFRDLFQSIIGKDATINPVEKLHYLKASLKGEAELLIRSLPTTNENFDRAWKTLTDYYENKKLLIRSYISKFTNLPKLKGESAPELHKLYHSVRNIVESCDSIGRSIMRGEDLFVHLLVDLLDTRSRREWENSISDTTEPPSYATLSQFLERRLHTLESLQSMKPESSSSKPAASRSTRTLQTSKQDNKRGQCSLCKKDHFIMMCDIYKSKTAEERKRHIETENRCLNCLGKHRINECPSLKSCSVCNAKHHSSLHDAFPTQTNVTSSHVTKQSNCVSMVVLLATARVRVMDRFGNYHVARALIDQGSESSLISESLAHRLKLPRSPSSVAIIGVGGQQTGFAHGRVTINLTPLTGGVSFDVSALVFPRLTVYDGGLRIQRKQWSHLKGLQLADPEFNKADSIDLLLGADVFAKIIQPGLKKGGSQEPIGQETSLGWILSGPIGATPSPRTTLAHQCRSEEELSSLVKQFWQQEELSPATHLLTPEEKECEDFFRRTFLREANGRYVVRLPVKDPLPDLSSTRSSARRVLLSMEGKFQRSNDFSQLYLDFMQQYEKMGHMSKALQETQDPARMSYLPHHGVMRESSTTTRLRVVFNGSAQTPAGASLNQSLLVGANLLPQLADVLLRWRQHRYVFVTDIEKMYRQILVHPDDRDLQRILWRYQPSEGLNEYRLNTVTYGLSCAPFLAMRTLRQLAEDEEQQYPLGAEVLRQDVYMDDILTGSNDISKAQKIQKQLTNLCMAGGFPLRKWSANDPTIINDVPTEHRLHKNLISWQAHETHATLGLHWHPGTDFFSFSTSEIKLDHVSKRSVLSLTARLFDPLGWLSPVVVRAKIAFQSTWLQGLSWDDLLGDEATRWWNNYQSDLPSLEKIRIPRWLSISDSTADLDLHGFADASERAYGAVIYLRIKEEESWRITLVTAKTKVAPIKQVSLPRLELCAATLLARLAAHVQRILSTHCTLHLWSDSTVALGWIRGHPTKWKTYVANRVSEIQTSVPDAVWHHVPTKDNPADLASRGLSPTELVTSQLWWSGPAWLQQDSSSWPKLEKICAEEPLQEERTLSHASSKASTPIIEAAELLRHSSLNRLLRVTAWCLRWLPRNQLPRTTLLRALTVEELETARQHWILLVQATFFKQELSQLQQGKALLKSNSLSCLSPFIDDQGLLRVGGRIRHAILSYDERHPVILPAESRFTHLVIEACHRRSLHGGVQMTLGMLRQQYWVPRGRVTVKQLIHRCIVCTRWRAAAPQPLMGDLPRERIRPSRAFLHTGVDYAGPILLRTSKGRGQRSYKAYIAVFVCLSTRAVHLEVVSDYSTEAFLAALRRFTSRRGLCQTLLSDCGTNFVGADARLRELLAASSVQRRHIADQLASDGIQWRFNPPAAPHFGGIWEAAVKSVKHHLRRVVGDAKLTFEEMSTLLAQIEACLNSRPLQALSDDPDDLTALTPGHFLVGSSLTAFPEPCLIVQPTNKLTRWQLLQQMRDHFWDRWSQEYLHSLNHRPKWRREEDGIRTGRLCLIRHENLPPTRWPLARIIRVHPGEDNRVRVVTVRTASSEFTRPVTKIILLPTHDDNDCTRVDSLVVV